jgi:hypothetical protein
LSDPVDSRGGYDGRSTLRRPGATPINDMSDDSGSENCGNSFLADVGPLENGDLSMRIATINHTHTYMSNVHV